MRIVLAPADSLLTTQWRPLGELHELIGEWRALADRAAEPNVFYEPAFALAAAPVFGTDAGAVLVWTEGGSPKENATNREFRTCSRFDRSGNRSHRRLGGLFPLRLVRRRYGFAVPLLVGWTHPFAPLGTPLIDRDAVAPVVSAFLDHVAAWARPPCLLLPFMADDGPVASAFDTALAERGGRQAAFGRHRRALLVPGEAPALGAKKRKELARQRRRLAETGTLEFELATSPAEVAAALADFLALEARGWKGRAGSAAAQTPALRAFVHAAVTGLAAEGKADAARLTLDRRPLACGLTLKSGRGAWFWKIAYDESLARFSPGVLMTLDRTAAWLREAPAFVDSCAAPDHSMIDHLWTDRKALSDRLIALPGAPFALARGLESCRRGALWTARRARDLVRRATLAGRPGRRE